MLHGLQAVAGLRRGKTQAKDSEPVRPIRDDIVDAVKPFGARQVWAMIDLQRLTGMRPGEVVRMRGRDVDLTGDAPVYRPAKHKTQHQGHERAVYIGPKVLTKKKGKPVRQPMPLVRLACHLDLFAYQRLETRCCH